MKHNINIRFFATAHKYFPADTAQVTAIMIRKLIRDANRQKENGHELSVSYSYLYQNNM